jgi:hypothetical protein
MFGQLHPVTKAFHERLEGRRMAVIAKHLVIPALARPISQVDK